MAQSAAQQLQESAASEEFDFGLTDEALLGLNMRAAVTAPPGRRQH